MRQREVEEFVVELAAARGVAKEAELCPPPADGSSQDELCFVPEVARALPLIPAEGDPAIGATACGPALGTAAAEAAANAPATGSSRAGLPTALGETSRLLLARRDSMTLEAPGVLRVSFRTVPRFLETFEAVRRISGRKDGKIGTILTVVFEDYLARQNPRAWKRGGRRMRRIPQGVKDLVWRRDEGRCMFTAPDGVRCSARNRLEFDHIRPWSLGGASDDPANIRLLCRAHNLRSARKVFGERVPAPRPA